MKLTSDRLSFLIRKRIDENNPLQRNDFTIDKLSPHLPFGPVHEVMKDAAGRRSSFCTPIGGSIGLFPLELV
jgi:hypothetical protein